MAAIMMASLVPVDTFLILRTKLDRYNYAETIATLIFRYQFDSKRDSIYTCWGQS